MIVLYTIHCPGCVQIQNALDDANIEYIIEDTKEVVYQVAADNNILESPFAKIGDKILSSSELKKYIYENRGN